MLSSSAVASAPEAVAIRCSSVLSCVLYSASVSGCAAPVCATAEAASRIVYSASTATRFISRAGRGAAGRIAASSSRHHQLQVVGFFANASIEILQRERNRQDRRYQGSHNEVHQICRSCIPDRQLL